MEVEPTVKGSLACWSSVALGFNGGDALAMGVWTEKRAGLGEDAEPLLLHNGPESTGLIAVFDGVGGAGSSSAGTSHHGNNRTGAWVASRIARAATEEWFNETFARPDLHTPDSLRSHLAKRLAEGRPSGARKILGSMRRELPSTVAALRYTATIKSVRWTALWAGDSRAFLLRGGLGLQQLTIDDSGAGDALAALIDDPPMTNYACADKPFTVNTSEGESSLPALLLCATDGFFGYVDTPAAFEYILLSTMDAAHDLADWCARVGEAVMQYSSDDATLSMLAFGWRDFLEMCDHFGPRLHVVEAEHYEPVRQSRGDRAAFTASRDRSWALYREFYEQRLPPPSSGSPS